MKDSIHKKPRQNLRERARAIKPFRCKNLIAVLEEPADYKNVGTVIRNVNALGVEKAYVIDSRNLLPGDWAEMRDRKSLSATSACEAPAGYVVDTTDCEDQQASIHPGAAELCDGLDQDCDGAADDGLSFVNWYTDSDGDGYGDPASAQSACTQPASTLADGSDCDDADATAHPSAPEVCDGNDQDCDGIADNGLPIFVVYTDSDGDGYGAGAPRVWCEVLAGRSTVDGDCDNQDAAINPAAQEVCNGVDDDCDQLLDATDPSVSG
ncbi:MAG TPA: MopE-related protein, partial [Leptospiraceae bacterium]|nr:MopE-related protein [Leptospiraceae bacterium]